MDKVTKPTLLKKGAEASLFLTTWHGKRVVVKTRLQKKYRPEKLDLTLRNYRTIHEPQLMHVAKKAGVPTPTIYMVDVTNSTITMDFVEGKPIKQVLDALSKAERQELCVKIGQLIGILHTHGVIHGDLTTSNMILSAEKEIFLVDFGLGDKTNELEARGVDLHLLKRALQSTHYNFADECFIAVIKGYSASVGADATTKILEKIREIEKRGRYNAERKQDT
jgi:TP53 regulating kinase and related kinases